MSHLRLLRYPNVQELRIEAIRAWVNPNLYSVQSDNKSAWAVIVQVTCGTVIACSGRTEREAWIEAISMADGGMTESPPTV